MSRSRVATALALGRVSNLPTVWTNVLAGLSLAGVPLAVPATWPLVVALAVALSLFYVGGMYLNDAFDRGWDARHRPTRPIPAGEARAAIVLAAGAAMLAAGLAILWLLGSRWREPVYAGLGLAALIVVYDLWHKGNPVAPLLMAGCRFMVYVVAGFAVAPSLRARVAVGGAALLVHVVVLSVLARREAGDPRLPGRIALLIAAISLIDAAILAATGNLAAAPVAIACFFLTRVLQRRIAGT